MIELAKKAFNDGCYRIDVSTLDSEGQIKSSKVLYFDGDRQRIRLEGSVYNEKSGIYRPFKYEISFDDLPKGNLWETGEQPIARWALRVLAQDFFETNNSLGVFVEKRKLALTQLDQSKEDGKQLAGIFARSIADLSPIEIGNRKIIAGGENMNLISATIDAKGFISELIKREASGSITKLVAARAKWPNDTLPLGAMVYQDGEEVKGDSSKPFGVVLKRFDGKILVSDILPNSDAEKYGVEVGWYISRVGNIPITDTMSSAEIIKAVRNSSSDPIYFLSNGKEVVIKRD